MDVCSTCSESFGFHLPFCGVPDSGLRKQTSRKNCLPTAFAIVLGCSVEQIIADVNPENIDRDYHVMELTWWAMQAGRVFTPFSNHVELDDVPCNATGCSHGQVSFYDPYTTNEYFKDCEACSGIGHEPQPKLTVPSIRALATSFSGVLTGRKKDTPNQDHAVAWRHDKQRIYDPNFTTYSLNEFEVDDFWVLAR